jgi:hypothetical protein
MWFLYSARICEPEPGNIKQRKKTIYKNIVMETILKQMKRGQKARERETTKQRLIGEYEQKLNYAYDFNPHKVEYYKELLNQAKNLFK